MSALLKKTFSMTHKDMAKMPSVLKKAASHYCLRSNRDENLEKGYFRRLQTFQNLSEALENTWSLQSVEHLRKCHYVPSVRLKKLLDPAEDDEVRSILSEDDLVIHFENQSLTWQPGRTYFCGKWSCDRCQSKSIQTERVVKGKDRDQEEFGTIVYLCKRCGLLDWCSYHDSIEKEDDEFLLQNASCLV